MILLRGVNIWTFLLQNVFTLFLFLFLLFYSKILRGVGAETFLLQNVFTLFLFLVLLFIEKY